jgi:hypothetical protein
MAELLFSEEEQRVVEEGEAAGFLLDSPAYLTAVEKIRKDCAEQMLTSAPSAAQVREDLYNLSRGLSAVTEQLLQMQADAVSIIENAKLVTTPDDEEVQADEPDFDASY